jgi:outer membrane protein OmpA-like peptidoglycan-associated protein
VEAVRDYLLKTGIDAMRVEINSYGERRPVGDNKSEEGRRKNRRVEVIISR